jgi:hypothetical protein
MAMFIGENGWAPKLTVLILCLMIVCMAIVCVDPTASAQIASRSSEDIEKRVESVLRSMTIE